MKLTIGIVAIIIGILLILISVGKLKINIHRQVNQWPKERIVLECQKIAATKTSDSWSYKSCLEEMEGITYNGEVVKI